MSRQSSSRLHPPLGPPARGRGESYWDESHRPWVILLVLLPLIIACEIGLATWPETVPAVQVTAHRRLLDVFSSLALPPPVLLAFGGIVTVVVLLVWQSFSRAPWRARPQTVGWMYIEGVAMALPLFVRSRLLLATPLAAGTELLETLPWVQRVVLSIAAGLYEELLFRMALIALIHAILVDIAGLKHAVGLAIAVLVSAAAFTWYHDPGAMSSVGIVFTALAGVYLGFVYVARGFGIVVIAHVVYDVIVMLRT
ncbi:MAG: CPBP family intramembrane glutamic endopeptidase [Planctomycetota bacterium]|nr:CPBP family intramembrane glutamic endopeptidase [Planctomycetota bacterium]